MSVYLEMGGHVNLMSEEETDEMINKIAPAKGIRADFHGLDVNDVDLLEALRFHKGDLPLLRRRIKKQERS